MEMVSLQAKLQTEQVAGIKLRARVAQLEPLEHTRLMRERFTSATAQLQTASDDLVRVTARLQELLSLPFLTDEQAEEQAKASAMHTSLRQDIARLTAEVNSCATAATATGAAELEAAANELAAAQRQTQLERTLRERAQEELRTGKALQAWLAVAQPMRALGTKPTWENLADTMAKSFVHINIPVEARKALYSIRQQTRTSEYLRHFRLLLARVTEPKPADADLLNFYYTGLKQTLRDQCKLNPKTGRFWDNFEELADFTLQIDLHSRSSADEPQRPVHLKSAHTAQSFKLSHKRKSNPAPHRHINDSDANTGSQDRKRPASAPPSEDGGCGARGGGRGGRTGGRGRARGRGDYSREHHHNDPNNNRGGRGGRGGRGEGRGGHDNRT
ncbi:MAG: hypothetical protein ACT6RN_27225 [Agrobacterium sp.]|uniref:hypothetical protein n=1 Tax=Agrobacterium sp. TaxID=361 RepID=UPI0040378E7C